MQKDRYKVLKLSAAIVAVAAALILGIEKYKIFKRASLQEELVIELQPYETFYEGKPVALERFGKPNDGGYVVPTVAFEKTDILMGYGIDKDISFEESFSYKYNKPSYGFDCSTEDVKITNDLCHFVKSCIGTDKTIYKGTVSNNDVSSFTEQITKLELSNKRIFIKMDIEGGEYDSLYEILNNSTNITGIVLELHFTKKLKSIEQALDLVRAINTKFFLLHIHANNYVDPTFTTKNTNGYLPTVIELTYINKNLTDKYIAIKESSFPKNFDMPNCPQKKDIEFNLTY